MECYIDLTIEPIKKYTKFIDDLIDCFKKGKIQNASIILKKLDNVALKKFNNLLTNEYTSGYMRYMVGIQNKKTNNIIHFDEIQTGGLGFDFAVALVDLLGPYCKKITANITHDDEYGNIPERITYHNGCVYVNDKHTDIRVFEEEEINLWLEEPIFSKEVLKPIHEVAKKVSQHTNFSELAKTLIALYDPIIYIARENKLLTDLLDGDDKEEYIEYIEKVLALDVYKKDHCIFNFFKNKIYENIIEISTTEYFGSILQEYTKTLLVFYIISDSFEEDGQESFEEITEDMHHQEDFDILYECTALLKFSLDD